MAASMRPGILKKSSRENDHIHKKNLKKGRLIVRNLSFKVSDSKLKEVFSKYGNVVDVNIPLKPDGKKRGFAFVQFEQTKDAINAINGLNSKNIFKRPVAVDFAVCKRIYESTTNQSDLEVVEENFKPQNENPLSSRHGDDDEDSASEKGESSDSGLDSNKDESDSENDKSEDDKLRSEDEGDDDSDSSDEDKGNEDWRSKRPAQKIRRRNPDAGDGRTLFIRNLSFQSHEEDLEELMEEFGEVDYAVLCHDPSTDLPKGTGFVRFAKKESADACLAKATDSLQGGVLLDGRQLNITLALERKEAQKMSSKEEDQGKDKRNLYLSREGLIRQGTQAAEGVSKTDFALRSRLEYKKRNALRNLHFFVSRTRLCIHNLPPSCDNRMLKQIFLKAANDPKARVIEARVMREQKGLGVSKGFGFVEFTSHEHALTALRNLNNNPNTFTVQKRPIVEFSIENKNALNAKLKRKEKSKALQAEAKSKTKAKHQTKKSSSSKEGPADSTEVENRFSGFKSKKDIKNLPSHFGPKIRHKKPKVDLNAKKGSSEKNHTSNPNEVSPKKSKKKKTSRKGNKEKKDFREEREFQTLVNKYRGGLATVSEAQRKKWYEAD